MAGPVHLNQAIGFAIEAFGCGVTLLVMMRFGCRVTIAYSMLQGALATGSWTHQQSSHCLWLACVTGCSMKDVSDDVACLVFCVLLCTI